ncbi:MAG TPA: DUF6600 domain-containing protein [Ideonella sp.]|uniref:DUF6600 domain-containing protein n=1 Tax=Ideonella sp. TaxID=1929293 RepID=UPI002E34F25E|nr:DUF6600 domain-containing protein [Ideonella sp.]HEX5685183.1 DUF6600 domain-containing protein [Ideonella sp.]
MKTFQEIPSASRTWRPWERLLAVGVALLATSGWALADPPGRVARLGYVSGQVSFSPAGEDDWAQAVINRPITVGDRLWADAGSRAELQVGGAMVRLNDNTAVSVLNLDDDITQLQLTEGSLNVRVRRLEPNQYVEVDTPNLAFTLRQPGAYRIDVDPDGTNTVIRMREGEGEASGESASYLIQAPQVQRFSGDALRDEGYASVLPPDDFDRWAGDRDRSYRTSVSAQYVSPDVVGYEDLDDNGSWSPDPSYGHVWYPRRVAVGWAPYRDGHWAWIDPWGWTWVDHAPWGYAVSHYGRWAHIRGRWGWVPGPVRVRATYAPALVAFVGGPGFSLEISVGGGGGGGVGWFPLGPREVYRPAYKVSPAYLERVNVSNTVINKTVIKNIHVTNVTNITYVNRRVPGAVVAVSQDTFRSAQPVAKAVIKAPREVIEGREVVAAAPIAPTEKSLRAAGEAKAKPPARAFTRQVVAKTEPPPPKASFAAQRERLAARPGQPLDDEERKQLRATPAVAAAASAAAPAVKVVSKKTTTAQTLAPRASKASEAGDVVPAAGQASAPARKASAPKRRDKAEPAASAPAERASAPARKASAPAKATAAERRASAAEARKQREDRKARAPGEAASAPAPAAAASPSARPQRPAAGASAAEGRKPQRAPAGEAAPAPRESADGAAPAREAAKPRTAEERQAKRAERAEKAARRASEAEEGQPRKEP